MSKYFVAAVLCLALLPHPAKAHDIPQFIQPVQCVLGNDCWITNYVDTNPQDGKAEDFTCGPRSYDAHKGTDFAIKDRRVMRDGVNVLAAKDGTVERVRDGQDDLAKAPAALDGIRNSQTECGNGVFIDHGAAIKTTYCHLKQGSISVKPGDKVRAGDIIGQVGQSGLAEFPHLHFGVLWENGVVDPFTGALDGDGCGQMKRPLWFDNAAMAYQHFAVYDGGFRGDVPDFKAIEEGQDAPDSLQPAGKALVVWGAFYGVREGDRITLSITDPNGRIFAEKEITQATTRARQYYYTGRTLAGKTMPEGTYTGIITLTRTGAGEQTKTVRVDLHP